MLREDWSAWRYEVAGNIAGNAARDPGGIQGGPANPRRKREPDGSLAKGGFEHPGAEPAPGAGVELENEVFESHLVLRHLPAGFVESTCSRGPGGGASGSPADVQGHAFRYRLRESRSACQLNAIPLPDPFASGHHMRDRKPGGRR